MIEILKTFKFLSSWDPHRSTCPRQCLSHDSDPSNGRLREVKPVKSGEWTPGNDHRPSVPHRTVTLTMPARQMTSDSRPRVSRRRSPRVTRATWGQKGLRDEALMSTRAGSRSSIPHVGLGVLRTARSRSDGSNWWKGRSAGVMLLGWSRTRDVDCRRQRR